MYTTEFPIDVTIWRLPLFAVTFKTHFFPYFSGSKVGIFLFFYQTDTLHFKRKKIFSIFIWGLSLDGKKSDQATWKQRSWIYISSWREAIFSYHLFVMEANKLACFRPRLSRKIGFWWHRYSSCVLDFALDFPPFTIPLSFSWKEQKGVDTETVLWRNLSREAGLLFPYFRY